MVATPVKPKPKTKPKPKPKRKVKPRQKQKQKQSQSVRQVVNIYKPVRKSGYANLQSLATAGESAKVGRPSPPP